MGRIETDLFDLDREDVADVRSLEQHQQVEVPRPAEVRDKYRPHRQRREETNPRNVRQSGDSVGVRQGPQRVFYVQEFFRLDGRMLAGFLEDQPIPRGKPQDSYAPVEVEGGFPAGVFYEDTSQWQAEHDTRVTAAEG